MDIIIYSFNLNISPKMSCGVLECDVLRYRITCYDFVTENFVIKKGGAICAAPCMWLLHGEYTEGIEGRAGRPDGDYCGSSVLDG